MSLDDRQLIDQALAAGRVTVCPPAPAAGLAPIEDVFWAPPYFNDSAAAKRGRGHTIFAIRRARERALAALAFA